MQGGNDDDGDVFSHDMGILTSMVEIQNLLVDNVLETISRFFFFFFYTHLT